MRKSMGKQHATTRTTSTFIYTKKEMKKNTLILKSTNMVFAGYNNHTAKKTNQLSVGYNK